MTGTTGVFLAFNRIARRLGPYGASTIVTFATGVVSVPVIIAVAGSTQWSGLAVAQSVAAIAAIAVNYGWNATGPTMIAATDMSERQLAFWRSLIARLTLFAAFAPIAALIAVMLVPISPVAAALATLGYLVQALGAGWYFVGEARPMRMLLLDTLPRTVGILAGLTALAATRSITVYAAFILLGSMGGVVLGSLIALRGFRSHGFRPALLKTLRGQRHGLIATTAGTLYANAPLIIASLLIPARLDVFALGFKLFQYVAAAFVPVVQYLQGWAPAGGTAHLAPRVRIVRRIALLGAAISAPTMSMAFPLVAMILSAGKLQLGYSLAIPLGLATGGFLLNQLLGLVCLTSLGRSRDLAVSTTLGACTGLALMVALSLLGGPIGLGWALAATEWLVAFYQLQVVARALPGASAEALP